MAMDFSANPNNVLRYHKKCKYVSCYNDRACAYGMSHCVEANGPYTKVPALTRVEDALAAKQTIRCPHCATGTLAITPEDHLICIDCKRPADAETICRQLRL